MLSEYLGKRQNVLRKRTDSWLFDVDQLLFGTVLFTLLAFISPTTMVYYAFFALVSISFYGVYFGNRPLIVILAAPLHIGGI